MSLAVKYCKFRSFYKAVAGTGLHTQCGRSRSGAKGARRPGVSSPSSRPARLLHAALVLDIPAGSRSVFVLLPTTAPVDLAVAPLAVLQAVTYSRPLVARRRTHGVQPVSCACMTLTLRSWPFTPPTDLRRPSIATCGPAHCPSRFRSTSNSSFDKTPTSTPPIALESYLKNARMATTANAAVTSGRVRKCSALQDNVDWIGFDIGSAAAVAAEDCCSLCRNNWSCQAYVWSNVNGGTCWFKSARGAAQTKLGVRSSLVLF
ncbi:hypothetical protein SPRG_17205 [Saprolegnia parasitica CBS 223.65]|uniref:Apple domain-containing protein n=1 Tax=Saprolegnia parasitica (strain CBS 223.65) TaxID=695850 RepID=A0A067BRS1_SAPPC|nr:hypothetical protein SPRG_17205 [Saprolegnia parasitica CBS 223.65]KDO17367.1 hypothetical protein SPRG_17205 [Saprolegnia parasitica CBS 223.65]|eukprot:XP_012211927.1 hypothetical protein SPRG_17205 [Saprolegnia parasitica CBS 223.65]